MPADALLRAASPGIAKAKPERGFVVIQPRFRRWLAQRGLVHAADFLALRGEIVSGHHDRHVLRVEFASRDVPRVAYLKREHRIGWRIRRRNRRAGFGPVSRCEREAMMLQHLESQGLPGPQWIACGEDGRGRAFLLVEDLAGSLDLRIAARNEQDSAIRRESAERIGTALGELHAAGIATPDLAAKHVFLDAESASATLIDWPSAIIHEAVSWKSRALALAQLDASLAAELAAPRERLRLLRAYLRVQPDLPPLRDWLTRINRLSASRKSRSSIRDQQCEASIAARQRLVWLAEEEAVCVTPSLAECWPSPAICRPFYPTANEGIRNGEPAIIIAPDGRPATLLRWRTVAPLGRIRASLRGQSWRSPATKAARKLFRDERAGLPAATLLAFGQRTTGAFTAESFLLMRTGAEAC